MMYILNISQFCQLYINKVKKLIPKTNKETKNFSTNVVDSEVLGNGMSAY